MKRKQKNMTSVKQNNLTDSAPEYLIDSTTGYLIEPVTNYLINPVTGKYLTLCGGMRPPELTIRDILLPDDLIIYEKFVIHTEEYKKGMSDDEIWDIIKKHREKRKESEIEIMELIYAKDGEFSQIYRKLHPNIIANHDILDMAVYQGLSHEEILQIIQSDIADLEQQVAMKCKKHENI
ncbi:MAG: hypothetical protein FWG64_12985 [Firmicutes bacterium]|nr:hypothetical protein [Bacillota bacterium]